MYKVFTRTWWRNNPAWPDGLEPCGSGRRTIISKNIKTVEEARSICEVYNANHEPGRLSRKAEYTEH